MWAQGTGPLLFPFHLPSFLLWPWALCCTALPQLRGWWHLEGPFEAGGSLCRAERAGCTPWGCEAILDCPTGQLWLWHTLAAQREVLRGSVCLPVTLTCLSNLSPVTPSVHTQYTCLSMTAVQGLYLQCLRHLSHACRTIGCVMASWISPYTPEVNSHTHNFTCMMQAGKTLFYDSAWPRERIVPQPWGHCRHGGGGRPGTSPCLRHLPYLPFIPWNLMTSELSQESE